MRTLKHILFTAAVMICFSMTAAAQKDGDKNNPPPKKDPPVVVVKDKDKDKPKNDKPKDDKKKPQAFVFYNRDKTYFG